MDRESLKAFLSSADNYVSMDKDTLRTKIDSRILSRYPNSFKNTVISTIESGDGWKYGLKNFLDNFANMYQDYEGPADPDFSLGDSTITSIWGLNGTEPDFLHRITSLATAQTIDYFENVYLPSLNNNQYLKYCRDELPESVDKCQFPRLLLPILKAIPPELRATKIYIYDLCFYTDHMGRLGNQLFDISHVYCFARLHQEKHPADVVLINKSGYLSSIDEGNFLDIFKTKGPNAYVHGILREFGEPLPFRPPVELLDEKNIIHQADNLTYICIRRRGLGLRAIRGQSYVNFISKSIHENKFNNLAFPLDYNTQLIDLYREDIVNIITSGLETVVRQDHMLRSPSDLAVALHYRAGDFSGYSIDTAISSDRFPVISFFSIHQVLREHYPTANTVVIFAAFGDRCIVQHLSLYLQINGWITSTVKDSPNEETDMLNISKFSNIISSSSTFGFWSSYLARPKTKVTIFKSDVYQFTYLPKNFIAINEYFRLQLIVPIVARDRVRDYSYYTKCDTTRSKCIGYKEMLDIIKTVVWNDDADVAEIDCKIIMKNLRYTYKDVPTVAPHIDKLEAMFKNTTRLVIDVKDALFARGWNARRTYTFLVDLLTPLPKGVMISIYGDIVESLMDVFNREYIDTTIDSRINNPWDNST